MIEKNTDTSARATVETKKEVVKEEYNNETAENGEAKIIEVSYNINRFVHLKNEQWVQLKEILFVLQFKS